MIYGAMRDKAIDEVADILFPLADELILTAANSARALRPEALAEMAGRGRTAPEIASAIDLVKGDVADDVVVITGSLYVVGEARAHFMRAPRQPWG